MYVNQENAGAAHKCTKQTTMHMQRTCFGENSAHQKQRSQNVSELNPTHIVCGCKYHIRCALEFILSLECGMSRDSDAMLHPKWICVYLGKPAI